LRTDLTASSHMRSVSLLLHGEIPWVTAAASESGWRSVAMDSTRIRIRGAIAVVSYLSSRGARTGWCDVSFVRTGFSDDDQCLARTRSRCGAQRINSEMGPRNIRRPTGRRFRQRDSIPDSVWRRRSARVVGLQDEETTDRRRDRLRSCVLNLCLILGEGSPDVQIYAT
jgi:hypothetical protein